MLFVWMWFARAWVPMLIFFSTIVGIKLTNFLCNWGANFQTNCSRWIGNKQRQVAPDASAGLVTDTQWKNFQANLVALEEMGWKDKSTALQALINAKGDLQNAVQSLLENRAQ